jgi:hypothetical protein
VLVVRRAGEWQSWTLATAHSPAVRRHGLAGPAQQDNPGWGSHSGFAPWAKTAKPSAGWAAGARPSLCKPWPRQTKRAAHRARPDATRRGSEHRAPRWANGSNTRGRLRTARARSREPSPAMPGLRVWTTEAQTHGPKTCAAKRNNRRPGLAGGRGDGGDSFAAGANAAAARRSLSLAGSTPRTPYRTASS